MPSKLAMCGGSMLDQILENSRKDTLELAAGAA